MAAKCSRPTEDSDTVT